MTGLPDRIVFKNPLNYGSSQINKIMKHQEDISFDENLVAEFLAGKLLIEEKQLEVTDLLNKQEFQFLTQKCLKFFTKDGWKSPKANDECACEHEGHILPVYTESKEPYWLFYYPGKILDLHGMQEKTKIWGYWLDQTMEKLIYELILGYLKGRIAADILSICFLPDRKFTVFVYSFSQKYKYSVPPQQELCESCISLL